MNSGEPSRGEVWDLQFEPAIGHEQAGSRPALILSEDLFNEGPAGMVVVADVNESRSKVVLRMENREYRDPAA